MTGTVFGMLCYIGFSANIISTLTQSRSLKDFSELMNYGGIEVAFSYFEYFQVSLNLKLINKLLCAASTNTVFR